LGSRVPSLCRANGSGRFGEYKYWTELRLDGPSDQATVFCHERTAHNGLRRLVIIEGTPKQYHIQYSPRFSDPLVTHTLIFVVFAWDPETLVHRGGSENATWSNSTARILWVRGTDVGSSTDSQTPMTALISGLTTISTETVERLMDGSMTMGPSNYGSEMGLPCRIAHFRIEQSYAWSQVIAT